MGLRTFSLAVFAYGAFSLVAGCGGGDLAPEADGGTDAGGDGGHDASALCATSAACGDGVFCNGDEACTPGAAGADARGCVAGTTPCAGEMCVEATDSCAACSMDVDADGDGHSQCDDCDDDDAASFPGGSEVCDAVGHDEDCNDATFGTDGDTDSFVSTGCCNTQPSGALFCGDDCDDMREGTHPGATEVCNGIDDDCNSLIDDGAQAMVYADADGDGFGSGPVQLQCADTAGFSSNAGDCLDSDASVHPGATDFCDDPLDSDCLPATIGTPVLWYRDADDDGYYAGPVDEISACTRPAGHSRTPGDCNDADPAAYLGAPERCDNRDNDCDGLVDDVGADGSCAGMIANATAVCRAGACVVDACFASYGNCNASSIDGCETDVRTAVAHCGACGSPCVTRPGSIASCVAGSCDYLCAPGYQDCSAAVGCESPIASDAANCGACGTVCPARANAALATCAAAMCGFVCDSADFRDCNGVAADGCEIDLAQPETCGGCSTVCPIRMNATRTCVSGVCGYLCAGGFRDCNTVAADGCEIDSSSSAANCGTCGNACPAGANSTARCLASVCGITCAGGYANCNGAATDGCEIALNSVASCGSCTNDCRALPNVASPSCTAGACAIGASACAIGYANCNGLVADGCEVNLATDVNNCGACGYRVVSAGRAGEAALRTCVSGQPSPGWVPITTVGGPTNSAWATGVTGRHLLHVDQTSTRLYDFATDTWSTSLGAPPFPFPTIDTSPTRCGGQGISGISLVDRGEYFVWFTTGAYRFVDDASPRWLPVTTAGQPTTPRDWNTLAYDGASVYVMLGASGCVNDGRAAPYAAYGDAGSYDIAGAAWRTIGAAPGSWCGSYGAVSMTFAAANGLLGGLGGASSNAGLCSESRLLLVDPSTATWSPGPNSLTGGSVRGHSFISVGDSIFATTGSTTGWLMDPRGTSTVVTPPPGPAGSRSHAFAMFTGRAVFYWGGYDSLSVNLSGGSIGVVSTAPAPSILWRSLPTAGQPSAQYMQAVSNAGSNGQSLWTGHEAVISGGSAGGNRGRFQPPVGCVCPAIAGWTYSPACVGVTGAIPTSCAPM